MSSKAFMLIYDATEEYAKSKLTVAGIFSNSSMPSSDVILSAAKTVLGELRSQLSEEKILHFIRTDKHGLQTLIKRALKTHS